MLTKKDKKKRYNKKTRSLTGHEFGMGTDSLKVAKEAFSGSNLGGSIGAIAGGIGGIVEAGMANDQIADTTEQEQERDDRKNWQSIANDSDSLLAEMANDVSINENTSWKSVRGVTPGQMVGNTFKGMISGAGAGAQVGGPWGAVAGAAAGLASGIVGIFTGNAKAKKKAAELNESAKKANLAKAQTLTAKAGSLDQAADARAQAAYFAEGGSINTPQFPDFPSEVTEFNTGGSHEENPYDGIPQGIAPDGLPNLVEEGEVKYDNYIFSDRLMLNKNDKKKYKFLKGKTYADAAKAIKRELGIDERPNDLIAKTDLEEHLNILSMLQEEERAKRGLRGENRMMYKNGGHIFDSMHDILSGLSRKQAIDKLANTSFDYTDGAGNTRTWVKSGNRNWAKAYYKTLGLNPGKESFSSLLQAAPAIGSAIGTITSIFDKPTYEHTKRLTKPEKPITPITYTPTHQDIRLDRFDTNYHANKLASQAGATRRAVREQTGSNPYAATAALLSADANAQSQMGDLYRKAAEYNQGIALQEAQFNEAGRRADAEGLLKAASSNAALQDKALTRQAEKDINAARLNMAEDQAYDTAISANTTSLFDNLGAIGKERTSQTQAALKLLGDGITYTDAMLPLLEEMLGPSKGRALAEILKQKQSKGSAEKTPGQAYGGKLYRKKGYTI